MSRFKEGDRVKYLGGMCSVKPGTVCVIENASNDGYDYHTEDNTHSCWEPEENFSELITNEGGASMARKTYKLIKETPTVAKGAIYQEACDDGTQEYVLLDLNGFHKSTVESRPTGARVAVYDRSLVEDAPQWFVEVFQVEPQYMTREELDQWEAFKTRKAPAGQKTVKVTSTKRANNWTPARRKAHGKKIAAAWAARKAS